MDRTAMEGISSRLASIDGLYFPGAIHRALDTPQRKAALLDLLSRDTPIFLERYGSELTTEELAAFEALRGDYEVGWHLERIRRGREPAVRAAAVRNRRRAYMERLVRAGEYFSEDAMRAREPYLHHEYLGRFQDPAGRGMARPGERWSETLMRRWEEAVLVEKIRGEQQKLGVPKEDWVSGAGQDDTQEEEEEEGEEEEEEEDEEMEDGSQKKDGSSPAKERGGEGSDGSCSVQCTIAGPREQAQSADEMQEQLEQFTRIMQQKFLAGEDSEYLDYTEIDNDERLDDHWLKEVNYDAEEKYFDEDD